MARQTRLLTYHYSVLTGIILERYPSLEVDEHEIGDVLRSMPKVFERVTPGVYKVSRAEHATQK